MKPGGPRVFFTGVAPNEVSSLIGEYLVADRMPETKVLGYLGENDVEGVPDLKSLPVFGMQQRIALRNAGNTAPNDIYQYIANGGYSGLNKALYQMEPNAGCGGDEGVGAQGSRWCSFPHGNEMELHGPFARSSEVHSR